MAEYIEREAAIHATASPRTQEAIRKLPAADVAPVVHGRWEDVSYYKAKNGILYHAKRCSVCHADSRRKNGYNYCPNCGAKMDLEVNNE